MTTLTLKERFMRLPAPARAIAAFAVWPAAFAGIVLLGNPSGVAGQAKCTPNEAEQALIGKVKADLNDPASFEYSKSILSNEPGANGLMHLIMTFRAKNGFGATVLQKASAQYDPATCTLTDWTLI